MIKNLRIISVIYAFAAAVFYALNIPFSKLLLRDVPPTFMAAFLYVGAGIGVGIMYLFHIKDEDKAERLSIKDLPYTIGMIVLDIAAPIFLMIGIKTGSASDASLLGNFEIVATSLIALIIFKEKISAKLWLAIGFITASSMVLSLESIGTLRLSYGSLFVIMATCCWGLENNCTRKISEKSTYEIVFLKGIFSGGGAFLIAFLIRENLPEIKYVFAAMLIGFISYGLSIFLYISAQRELGAARTSAYYAAAPFAGAFLSFMINGDSLKVTYFIALTLMITGTVFVVYDTVVKSHEHEHTHTVFYRHNGIMHTKKITHIHSHSFLTSHHKHNHMHIHKNYTV